MRNKRSDIVRRDETVARSDYKRGRDEAFSSLERIRASERLLLDEELRIRQRSAELLQLIVVRSAYYDKAADARISERVDYPQDYRFAGYWH